MSKTIGVKLCKELFESNITSIVKIDKSFIPNDNTISIMNTDIRIQILSKFSSITTLNWQYIRGMGLFLGDNDGLIVSNLTYHINRLNELYGHLIINK